jgi:effector-binding domain-containing protein
METTAINVHEITPRVKEVKPINFLFHRAEVKVNDLANQVPVAKELIKEAVRLDLHPTGPIHWHYIGFNGEPSQSFVLEVCLPVADIPSNYDGQFHFKRTEKFRSVSLMHEGGWNEIPNSYAVLMEFVKRNNLQPVGASRELYINADFGDPEANVTEIQLGVK